MKKFLNTLWEFMSGEIRHIHSHKKNAADLSRYGGFNIKTASVDFFEMQSTHAFRNISLLPAP